MCKVVQTGSLPMLEIRSVRLALRRVRPAMPRPVSVLPVPLASISTQRPVNRVHWQTVMTVPVLIRARTMAVPLPISRLLLVAASSARPTVTHVPQHQIAWTVSMASSEMVTIAWRIVQVGSGRTQAHELATLVKRLARRVQTQPVSALPAPLASILTQPPVNRVHWQTVMTVSIIARAKTMAGLMPISRRPARRAHNVAQTVLPVLRPTSALRVIITISSTEDSVCKVVPTGNSAMLPPNNALHANPHA